MRNKDHHLQLRGGRYSIRYDIPTDLADCFPGVTNRTVREALGTGDKIEARKRRDHRLREVEQGWYRLRQAKRRHQTLDGDETSAAPSLENWALRVANSDDRDEREMFSYQLMDMFDRLAEPRVRRRDNHHDYLRAAEEVKQTPEGQRLMAALKIASGEATPIKAVADEWLATKSRVSSSSLYTYKKALGVLQERFQTVEEVTHRDARNFLFGLLKDRNKRTVGQYLIAYRGVWKHLGRLDVAMWNVEGMASAKDSVPILPWDDDDYIKLLAAAEAKGHRDMYLAIRIAAHTGAAASGIARLEVRDDEMGRSLFLHETKKEHRSRLIPCHPTIHDDIAEWQNEFSHDQISLSKKFGRLKDALGYGRDKVLHSFRHSVANKLENARVMDREIQRLLGHKIGKISFDTYNAQGLGYETLSKVVAEIRWPSVE